MGITVSSWTDGKQVEADDGDEDAAADDGDDTEKEDGDGGSDGEQPVRTSRITGRPFIQLVCVHCKEKCITFAVSTFVA